MISQKKSINPGVLEHCAISQANIGSNIDYKIYENIIQWYKTCAHSTLGQSQDEKVHKYLHTEMKWVCWHLNKTFILGFVVNISSEN